MKCSKLFSLFLITALLVTGCGSKETNTAEYLDEQDDIMEDMMEDMHDFQKTGSADLDFLYGMIPHHEAAIEMSESYLKYAKDDSEFNQLAKDIVSTQKDEVTQMKEMIKRLEENKKTDTAKEEKYLTEYDSMMSSHHSGHNGSNTENLDAAFAEGMIMHHQMAVDMAEAIVKYSDDEKVTQFAENIIELQEKEITQMQDYLDKNTGSGTHSGH